MTPKLSRTFASGSGGKCYRCSSLGQTDDRQATDPLLVRIIYTSFISGRTGIDEGEDLNMTGIGLQRSLDRTRNVPVLACMGMCLIAAAMAGCDDDGITALKPAGVFDPATIDFGEVTIGTTGSRAVLLKNTGTSVLSIDSIEVPAPFAIAATKGVLANLLLPLGESVELNVTFMASVEGLQTATIIARSGQLEIKLEVTATGVHGLLPDLSIAPSSLDFGTVALGSSDVGKVTVTNAGMAPGMIVKAVLASRMADSMAGDEYFATINYPHEVAAGATSDVDIVFAPQVAGARPDTLTFITSTGRELVLVLSGEGLVPQGNLVCSPSNVNFGQVERGSTKTENVGCTAMGGPVRLVSGQVPGGQTDFGLPVPVTTVDINAGSSVAIPVTFTAAGAPRVLNSNLSLNYNGSAGVSTLNVPLTAEVIPPPPSATAISLILRWNTNMTDVDLHLVKPGGTTFDFLGSDCYYASKNPDWNIMNDNSDDPFLDVDDIDGNGPEEINLQTTAPGRYDVYVHYFNDRFSGPSNATLDVFVAGQMVNSISQNLTCNDLWHAGTIDWDGTNGSFIPNGNISPSTEGICF
jgi:hypothetical protein